MYDISNRLQMCEREGLGTVSSGSGVIFLSVCLSWTLLALCYGFARGVCAAAGGGAGRIHEALMSVALCLRWCTTVYVLLWST